MRRHPALLFVLLTYLLTWSVAIPAALATHGYISIKVPHGLLTIATLSPGIIGLLLTAVLLPKGSVKRLFKTMVKWRIKLQWYIVVAILGIVLCALSLLLFDWATGHVNKPEPAYNYVFYFLLILPLSALWEETGWRGYLLPVLQTRHSPLKASLLIGFVWGLWHLPIYLAIDPYGAQTLHYFGFMFVGCFALSIFQTWLYNATPGSLLLCILFHNTINTSVAYFYGNLNTGEWRPLQILVVLLVIAAVVVALRLKHLQNGDGEPASLSRITLTKQVEEVNKK